MLYPEICYSGKEKEEGEIKERMSPQDKVERVLKEIHVTFSKSEMVDGHPDKVIIDRKKFLGLLDRLNQGIYDMMDQYEQTRQSRNNAERAFRKKGDEIIEAANSNAEDVYAASVIYTADMIGAIRDLMDQTNDSMNDLFMQFKKDLREQKDKLQSHENELQGQLADLADTKKYLSIIDDINRQRARKNRDLEAEKEAGVQYARNMMYIPPSEPDIKVNEQYFENSGTKRPEDILSDGAPVENRISRSIPMQLILSGKQVRKHSRSIRKVVQNQQRNSRNIRILNFRMKHPYAVRYGRMNFYRNKSNTRIGKKKNEMQVPF